MKVLQVGNIASVGYNLSKGLREIGVNTNLFTIAEWNTISQPKKKWIIQPKLQNNGFFNSYSLNFNNYDIVHLHYLQEKINLIISTKLILKAKKPLKVVHVHGSITAGTKEFIPRLRSYIVRMGAKVIFYSTPNLFEKIQRFSQKKIFLPNPLDTQLFRPLNEKIKENRVLCYIRIDPVKGIDKMLEIINLCPDINFDVLEWGPLVPKIKKILPSNARFIKPLPHDQVPKLIAQYPVILGQLEIGALGLSELEAMACGKPVITYWNRKYDKFYPEPCPVISINNPEDAAAKLNNVMNNPGEIGKKSRKWILKNHSIEGVSKELFQIYSDLLE